MEFISECITHVLLNGFQLYVVYRFMYIFFDNQYINKKYSLIAYAFMYFTGTIQLVHNVSPVVSTLTFLAMVFLIALSYHSGIKKKLIVVLIVYMCNFIAEAVVAFIIGISNFDIFGNVIRADAFTGILINIIFWSGTLIAGRFRHMGNDVSVPGVFIISTLIVIFSSLVIVVMIFKQQNPDKVMASFSFACILASTFIIIYMYDSLSRILTERTRQTIVNKEKDYYHEQLELLKRKQNELSMFRHDIKNHLAAIQQMIHDGQYENAGQYTDNIACKINHKDIYSSTGNIAIDSIINYKLRVASELGTNVRANITVPENIAVDEDDMVVILGNILDNASEALQKVDGDRYINIDISYDKGNMFVHIENSYDSYVKSVNGRLITRKKDPYLHGIGLQSVKSVVDKYNGQLDISHDEKSFVVDILIYV